MRAKRGNLTSVFSGFAMTKKRKTFKKLNHAQKFVVEREEGVRLDVFLKSNLPRFSRGFIQRLIASGKVTVNEKVSKRAYPVKRGDRINLVIPPSVRLEVKARPIPLDVLWEDDKLLVVNKPPGMLVHPTPSHKEEDTLVNALLFHCEHLSQLNGILRQGIVHRLDRDTSGAMVIAKDNCTHLSLVAQFQKREVKKVYLALARGRPPQDEGIIEARIGRNPRNGKKMAIEGKGSREAITHYRVRKNLGKWSLIELHPRTGRTHQIRLHLNSIGCFLIGDGVYGKRMGQDFPYKVGRGMLHAKILGFFHPQRRKWMEFEAPLPEDMKKAINYLDRGYQCR